MKLLYNLLCKPYTKYIFIIIFLNYYYKIKIIFDCYKITNKYYLISEILFIQFIFTNLSNFTDLINLEGCLI